MKQLSRNLRLAAMFGAVYMMAAVDDQALAAAGGTATGVAATDAPELTPEQKAANEAAATAAREALHTTIKANFNNQVDVLETNFHFRKVKDEASGVETKRPTVTIPVPAPSVEGLIAIIEKGGKGLDLLLEAVRDKVVEQAREQVNDKEDINADNFDYAKLEWEFIANLPKAERRGGGISKELWDDFAADYISVMPGVTGKKKESVELAAKVFTSKFANAKTNKPVLKVLQEQLAIYINNTTRGEEVAPVVEWLSNKVDTLLKTDETNLLLSL
jgi:hypothetical protein